MPKIQHPKMMNFGSGSCGRKGFETLGESDGYQTHHHHHKPHHFHHLPYEVLLLVLIFSAVSISSLVFYHWSYYIHLSPNSLVHKYSPNEADPDAFSATSHGDLFSMVSNLSFFKCSFLFSSLCRMPGLLTRIPGLRT